MMRSLFWVAVAMPCMAAPAFAHAFLEHASPPVGATVDAPPPELSIQFTEGVEPLFSTIEVDGANGDAVVKGHPRVAPDNNRLMIMALPKLPPGTYTVNWHATSVDTHKTEGHYKFTVTH
jgi:methionine-rich copper-binding protein CopC